MELRKRVLMIFDLVFRLPTDFRAVQWSSKDIWFFSFYLSMDYSRW
jgi:hypothetical protein